MLLTGFSVAYLTNPYQFSASCSRSRWLVSLVGRRTGASQRASVWPGVIVVPGLLLLAVVAFNTIRRFDLPQLQPVFQKHRHISFAFSDCQVL